MNRNKSRHGKVLIIKMTVRVHEVVDKVVEIARAEVFDPRRRDDDSWIDDDLPDNYDAHPVIEVNALKDSNNAGQRSVGRMEYDEERRIQCNIIHDTTMSYRLKEENKERDGEVILDEIVTQFKEAIVQDMNKDPSNSKLRGLSTDLRVRVDGQNDLPLDNSITQISVDLLATIKRG